MGKLTLGTLSKMRHFEPEFYGDLYKLKKIVEKFSSQFIEIISHLL